MRKCFLEKCLLAIITTMALWASQTSFANADTGKPLTTEMSLTTGTTVFLGEPIMLQARIVNTSDQTIALHLGTYSTEWYSISLTDAKGRPAAATTDTRPAEPTGLQVPADRPLSPGESITNYIVVTRNIVPPRPGRYLLTAHVHLPYGQVALDEAAPSVWKRAITAAGTSLTQDFTYSLSVTPTDLAKLHRKAAQLQQTITAHPDGDLNKTLTTALFSMPEAEAAASWRVLTSRPGMSSDLYASELKRLGTPTAADILAEMLSNPALSEDNKAYVSQSLNEMYNHGNAPLKSHIRGIAASFGISMPEKVAIPVAAD